MSVAGSSPFIYFLVPAKGWGNKNEDFQKTEMALEGKPFVLDGCPFHSL